MEFVLIWGLIVTVGAILVLIGNYIEERVQDRRRKRAAAKKAEAAHARESATSVVPASPPGSSRSDGPVYWATGTYDPERYYRETRGWSPEFKNYVRDAYGDLDTYESNHPD